MLRTRGPHRNMFKPATRLRGVNENTRGAWGVKHADVYSSTYMCGSAGRMVTAALQVRGACDAPPRL